MKGPVLGELGGPASDFAVSVAALLAVRVDHRVLTAIDRAEPFDAELWNGLAELGSLDVLTDEAATQLTAGLLAELGYAGLVSPLEPTLIAGHLCRELVATRALVFEPARPMAVCIPVTVDRGLVQIDRHGVLSGGPCLIEWLAEARELIVLARDPQGGYELVAVDADAPELHPTPVRGIDHCPLSVVEFNRTPAARVLARGLSADRCERALAVVQLLRAAVVAGVASRAADLTARHLLTRVQFGAPLARLQAPRQVLAEMAIELSGLTGLVVQAAARVDERDASAEHHCRVAAIHAVGAGERVLESAAHLHGGVGFMQEHLLHFFYRLGKGEQLRLGGVETLLATAADRLLPAVEEPGWDWLLGSPLTH